MRITGSEFADIVMLFLYDKLLHPEEIIEYDVNERFNAFMEVMARRGTKGPLLQCYANIKPQLRAKYRLMRNVFIDNNSTKTFLLNINKDERAEILKVGTFKRIKNFLKKIVTLGLAGGE